MITSAQSDRRHEFDHVPGICFFEGRVVITRNTPKGGDTVTVFEAMMIAFTFGTLLVTLIGLVVVIVKNMKK